MTTLICVDFVYPLLIHGWQQALTFLCAMQAIKNPGYSAKEKLRDNSSFNYIDCSGVGTGGGGHVGGVFPPPPPPPICSESLVVTESA